MREKSLQDIFIQILCCALNGTELDSSVQERLTPEMLSDLFDLSERHDLAHIVLFTLNKCGVLPDSELPKLDQLGFGAVYRQEQNKYAYSQICDILNQTQIPYIPLKGAVMWEYYPESYMRTSCDIDILVKEENLDAAVDALVQKGFGLDKRNYHDVSLYSPNSVHVELHFSLSENVKCLDKVLSDVWLYATQTDGYCYELSKEYFLFHLFAHSSYHFVSGGCGIRPLMDIWVMKHKMGIYYGLAKELLKKAGIYKFAIEMTALSDQCFSNCKTEKPTDPMLLYILNGGVYGTQENGIAITKAKTNNTFVYVLKRLFLPYRTMVIQFEILKKLPVLLPFCWIIRCVKMCFEGKMKSTVNEIKTATSVNKKQVKEMKRLRNRLGLEQM